jgi:hypothetical protein
MLTSAIAMATLLQQPQQDPGPAEMIRNVLRYYRSLKELLIEMERESTEGNNTSSYKQELQWKRGDGFVLKVEPGNPNANIPTPSYYKENGQIYALLPGGGKARSAVKLNSEKGSVPEWELAGGMVLSTVEETPSSGFVLNPQNDKNAHYKFGPTTNWRGEQVREIQMISKDAGASASFFVSPDQRRLVGVQYRQGRQSGWVHYRTQVLSFHEASKFTSGP